VLYLAYNLAQRLVLKLPLGKGYRIAVFIADIYYIFARKDREALRENMKVILGKDDKKLIDGYIRNVFRNFAKYLVDFFRFSTMSREYILKYINICGKENLDKTLARGKGAVILSAHIGNWELGGAVVGTLGYSIYAIALDHKDERVNNFFINQRAICDMKIIPIGSQLKNCFRILRKNSLLAILGDRDFSSHGVQAEFFGKTTLMPKGPAFFSLRTGAPIIPTFSIREKDDSFRLVFEEPIESAENGRSEEAVKSVMARYIAVIERYIRKYPDQWYAFRKIWNNS